MNINELIQAGQLDDSFPLPANEPFTYAAAAAAGVDRRTLGKLCTEGLLRRPIKGVYLGTHVGDSLALRAACLKLVVPHDCVVVDRHAAWLLGAEMVLRPNEHLALHPLSLFRPSGRGRLRNSIADSGERNLTADDIVEVDGMRVTSPIRTAWDLGRVRWTDEAIAGLDAVFRLRAFTRHEFLDGIERFRGMRWVTTLRAIGPLADGRSESPGESVLRLRCVEARLAVEPQVEVWKDGGFIARLDLANRELRRRVRRCRVALQSDTARARPPAPRSRRGDRMDGQGIRRRGRLRSPACVSRRTRRGRPIGSDPAWSPPRLSWQTRRLAHLTMCRRAESRTSRRADAPTRAPHKVQTRRVGQKMMSPDLRRERSSCRASSRMSAASWSERRSFT